MAKIKTRSWLKPEDKYKESIFLWLNWQISHPSGETLRDKTSGQIKVTSKTKGYLWNTFIKILHFYYLPDDKERERKILFS